MQDWQDRLNQEMAEVLFDAPTIAAKVAELGQQITQHYRAVGASELAVIGVLRGAVVFMSDLIRQIELPVVIDFIAASSYADGTNSSGTVRIIKDLGESIENKHVLLVEDIVDTGLTLQNLRHILETRRPQSISLCALLDKPSRRKTDVVVDYCGFQIPDRFVVGYGLDFAGHYRHLPFVGVLKPEAYEKS